MSETLALTDSLVGVNQTPGTIHFSAHAVSQSRSIEIVEAGMSSMHADMVGIEVHVNLI